MAIRALSENAGSHGMVGGQVLDMQSEERACTEQEVLDIQSRKTGALIRAACVLGVIAGGGTDKQLQAAADKNTFVRLYGLEKCEDLVHKYTSEAICQLNQFENTQDLISFSESLTTRRV